MVELNVQELSFEWDSGNTEKNKISHNVDAFESEEVFFNRPLILDDPSHSGTEKRYWAIGVTVEARRLHVTFTYRGGKIRVISARDMSKKERSIYEGFKKATKI